MLMYMFHIAFGVGLIALIMGLNMCCTKGSCESGKCGKCCGWIIVILAVISLLCTMHSGYQHYMGQKFDVEMMIDMDGMNGNGN